MVQRIARGAASGRTLFIIERSMGAASKLSRTVQPSFPILREPYVVYPDALARPTKVADSEKASLIPWLVCEEIKTAAGED